MELCSNRRLSHHDHRQVWCLDPPLFPPQPGRRLSGSADLVRSAALLLPRPPLQQTAKLAFARRTLLAEIAGRSTSKRESCEASQRVLAFLLLDRRAMWTISSQDCRGYSSRSLLLYEPLFERRQTRRRRPSSHFGMTNAQPTVLATASGKACVHALSSSLALLR